MLKDLQDIYLLMELLPRILHWRISKEKIVNHKRFTRADGKIKEFIESSPMGLLKKN